jgi:predicted PurR-regulated permease PerM
MLMNLAAFVVIVAGIMSAKSLILPFLLAIFLAIICAPPLFWMRKKGIPTVVSILLLVFILLGAEMLFASLIGSSIDEFSRSLPHYQVRLRELTGTFITWVKAQGFEINNEVLLEQLDPGKLMRLSANMLGSLTSLLTNTFMIILTLVFILSEAAGFPDKVRAMLGNRNAELHEYGAIMQGVNKYLALKTMTSLATGVMVTVLLKILGVNFAIMWGLVAVLLNFIPTIGSIIAAVPAVLLALVQLGLMSAAWVAGGYLFINILIGNILEPKIMGSGIGLSALVIFVSMAFWGWVLGPIGMLLSIPLTMTCKIALAGNPETRWLALLLGSNRDAAMELKESKHEQ